MVALTRHAPSVSEQFNREQSKILVEAEHTSAQRLGTVARTTA
jgi:hypothetical protein